MLYVKKRLSLISAPISLAPFETSQRIDQQMIKEKIIDCMKKIFTFPATEVYPKRRFTQEWRFKTAELTVVIWECYEERETKTKEKELNQIIVNLLKDANLAQILNERYIPMPEKEEPAPNSKELPDNLERLEPV